jgi:hypothetical protein
LKEGIIIQLGEILIEREEVGGKEKENCRQEAVCRQYRQSNARLF